MSRKNIEQRALSELSQSEQILEIRRTNPVFVSRYAQAMRAGSDFPPLLVTPDGVIVSGNHRYEAYCQEYPDDHKVDVIVREFADQADMIETAIRENATHGNPLDGISRKRAVLKLIELGRSEQEVAKLLGCSIKRIMSLAGQYVVVRGEGKKPVKRGLEHLSGQKISKSQYQDHADRDRAMHVVGQCEQLVRWLDNGWVDLEREENIDALRKLGEAIDKNIGVTA